MPVYEVGKSFVPCVIHWPQHAEYSVRDGGHELRLFWGSPPQAAITAILGAPCEFAVAHLGGVLFLLYGFEGGIDSSAAPYTPGHTDQRRTGSTRTAPGSGPVAGAVAGPMASSVVDAAAAEHDVLREVLSVYLVDADTGILRAMRTVSLSPSVSAALEDALREERAKLHQGDHAYGKEVSRARSQYSSAKAMLPYALAHCRCEA